MRWEGVNMRRKGVIERREALDWKERLQKQNGYLDER